MSDRKRNILDAAERIDYFGRANQELATELPSTVELFAANADHIERKKKKAESSGENPPQS